MSRPLEQASQRLRTRHTRSSAASEAYGAVVTDKRAKGGEAIRKAEREAATAKAIKLDGTLASVVEEITRLHNDILSAARTTLENAIRIGELLNRVRASRKGKWLSWLKDNAPFSERTARNYLSCYKRRHQLKSANVADLSSAYALSLPAPRTRAASDGNSGPEPAVAPVSDDVELAPPPTRRHKSKKHIERELQQIAEREQQDEQQANVQLAGIIEKLGCKVRAAWLEFPGHLAKHGKALSELAERLQFNTPRH